MVFSKYNENCESILVEHVLINALTSPGELRKTASAGPGAFGEGSEEIVKGTELRTFFQPFSCTSVSWNSCGIVGSLWESSYSEEPFLFL